ncbi:MAG: hypothetical protein C5B51_06230 [Terriglobia bacterium]|nr:MAG: hypothetical protein C5B51_06230 [Terriglobia bacterium]
MEKLTRKSTRFLPFILLAMGLAPVPAAHAQSSATRVFSIPDGAGFYVDGTYYDHAVSFIWPAGSKHTLYVNALVQTDSTNKTAYTFTNWSLGTQVLQSNPLMVTADPSISEIHAVFAISYALYVRFYRCNSIPSNCTPPGTIYVNGTATVGDVDLYFPAASTVVLQASPNPGYIFTGWQPGFNQVIQGFLNTVTMNAPVGAYPGFQVTRPITLNSDPPGLQVLADHTPVYTPSTLEWGWNTTHTVGPVSPQQDNKGMYWAFSSWSDGGAPTHSYQVAQYVTPDSLTATYVRAEPVGVVSSPAGFKIKVDGRDNWPSNTFWWGVGETHHLEAPAQPTDAQGRGWTFTGWSNGAPATQDFVVPADRVDGGVMLTATYQPLGRLTVTSSLAGTAVLVDGSLCKTPCDVQRPLGTQVRVSAPPTQSLSAGVRADFQGWADGSAGERVFTLSNDALTAAAVFRTMNQLIAVANPPEGAQLQTQPASPDGFYDAKASVTLTLNAVPGYRLRQWDGDASGSSPTAVVAMNAPRTVRALLDRVPYIAPTGVENAAGATPQPGIAPGSIASVYGGSMGNDTASGPASPLVQSLSGVTVTSGDRILPLFFVSPAQINFLLPADFPLGQAALTVSAPGQADLRATFLAVHNAPGIFTQTIGGQAYALALHEDGSTVTPDAPASAGELLTLYGTGFGPTDRPRPMGFALPAQPRYQITDPVGVAIGDGTVSPEASFAAPGRIGIDAVQFRINDPALAGTNASLHLTINGRDSNTVLLPVK